METCLLLSQSKPTYSKCYFEMVSFVHGLVGLTMVSLITSCTITSVACSVARHRRYTFSTIQTSVRRCQAAIKSRNVSCTILSTTNLEKRWICYRCYLKMADDLIFVGVHDNWILYSLTVLRKIEKKPPISPLGALQKGLVFKINYPCITYNE